MLVDNETKDIQNNEFPNYSLEELTTIEELSVRSCNVCKLITSPLIPVLADIINFYKQYKSFRKLKSCGEKSNLELIKLCKKYLNTSENIEKPVIDFDLIKPEHFKIKNINKYENLSVRAYNVCVDNFFNLKEILDYYFKNRSFKQLQNCGEKANSELIQLCMKYKNEISPPNIEEINYESNISIISYRLKINILDYIKDFKSYYDNKHIPLFKFIDVLLQNGNYFDNIEKEIIKNFYYGQQRTLDEIGAILDLSKERIRQKKNDVLKIIFHKQSAVMYIVKVFWDYFNKEDILIQDDLYIFEAPLIAKINSNNSTNFKEDFIIKIISVFNPEYNLINNFLDYDYIENLFREYKQAKHLKHFYFLKKDFEVEYVIKFIKYYNGILNTERDRDIFIKKHIILLNTCYDYKKTYKRIINEIENLIKKRNEKYDLIKDELIENIYNYLGGKVSRGIFNNNGKLYVEKHVKITKKEILKINFYDLFNFECIFY